MIPSPNRQKQRANGMRSFIAAILLVVVVPAALGRAASGQTPAQTQSDPAKVPAFEVISVKQDKLAQSWRESTPPDGYTANGITLMYLLMRAYNISPNYRIIGAPAWWDDNRYDIEAKVADSNLPALQALNPQQRGTMIQQVLTDRFKLKVHRELRSQPVYSLLVSKPGVLTEAPPLADGKQIGMGLKPGRGDRKGQIVISDFTTAFLAAQLSGMIGRMVIDNTGLTGVYHADLHWTPETRMADPDGGALSVFTALPEQAGLKLVPAKGPVECLIIDHVEQPSEN